MDKIRGEHDFEPQIVAYCCHHCAFAAADLTGALRIEYPANIKIIRLPCTGKIDVLHILASFENGADGVYIAGCLEGTCHFIKGNSTAKKRVGLARELLREAGIDAERLEMFNLSSAEASRFAEIARTMTDRIRGLGPIKRAGRIQEPLHLPDGLQ
jgi:F420-non-reducing hydrogenase iron-sulfur subunit